MTVDGSRREIWEDMQRQRRRAAPPAPELPLQGAGGGGTSGGMEARLAKLEASMEYVKAELARLSGVPAETARIAERTSHIEASVDRLIELPTEVARISERLSNLSGRVDELPTKADMQTAIESAVDRAGARTQRSVAIAGGLVTIPVAFITYAPKLLALLH